MTDTQTPVEVEATEETPVVVATEEVVAPAAVEAEEVVATEEAAA
jgi:hypothetical protein